MLIYSNLLLTLVLLNGVCYAFSKSADPDQLASDLDLHCVIKYVNLYQKPGLSKLIG